MLSSVSHFWSSRYNSKNEFIEDFGSLTLDHYFCTVIDSDGHFHFINSVLRRLISNLDFEKVKFMDLLNPEMDTILLNDLLLHIKKRIPWQGEITLKLTSGKIIWLDGIISPISLNDEPLFAFLFNDISERKIVEKALHESRQYFSNLIQRIPAGIFLANQSGECVMTNSQWKQMTGRSLAQTIGEKWIKSLHPGDEERVKKWWALSISSSNFSSIEFRYLNGSKTVYVLVNVVKIDDPFSGQIQFLRVEKDITDLKDSQNLFARKERQLIEAQR